jgi:hypothetical protein
MTTYTKLKDGSWGVRTTVTVVSGAIVQVKKKDGTARHERIARVLWKGNGVSLCAIVASASTSKGTRYGNRYECEECGNFVTEGDGSTCWETGAAH